jgi:glycosyltransferase involved in cell wall biosynthesis
MKKKTSPSPKPPFFSAIVPLYNKKNYVQRSTASVLGQTFRDFELIVVDDGSKDGSPEIVRSLKDKRVRLIVQENAGVSAARNRGVASARGRFITFLDADDDWDPGYLEALRGLIRDFPGAGLYGTNYWIDNGREKQENPVRLPPGWVGRMGDYYDLSYYGRPPFNTNTVCLPAALAKETPFPPGIKAGEDLLVWFKVSLRHDTVYLHKPFSTYYVEASENTHKAYFGPQYHLDWLDLGEKLKKEKILTKSGEKYVVWATLIQARKMIANGYRREAWSKWWRCPKTYFPLYQAALFLMFFFPLKQRKNLRPVFLRRSRPASQPGSAVEGKN